MEYVYSAMLLHSAGKEVSEEAVKKVLQSAGVAVDDSRVKALVTALKDVNIDEAIAKAAVVQAAPVAAASGAAGKADAKKEEAEEKKTEEEAASGLSALFG